RFSYPAFSNEGVRWQQAASRRNVRGLVAWLAAAGFSAILVDRYGYEDDGEAIVASLKRTVGDDHSLGQTDRYFALDISALAHDSNLLTLAGSTELVPATASMVACEGQPLMNIDQIGAAHAPFGAGSVHLPGSQALTVSGWAVDHPHRQPAGGVDIVMDRLLVPSEYGLNRDDVAKYFQRPAYRETGFVASVAGDALTRG